MKASEFLDRSVKELLRQLGYNLAEARRVRGRRVADLAEALSVNKKTILRMERGHPGVAMGVYVGAMHFMDAQWPVAAVKLTEPSNDAIGRGMRHVKKARRVRLHPREDQFILE